MRHGVGWLVGWVVTYYGYSSWFSSKILMKTIQMFYPYFKEIIAITGI
jgi:hypothetical protein